MRNEPYDISAFGRLPLNEAAWADVLEGRARRVFLFGGAPSGRFLPNALGLEPVEMNAYRYDAEGALTEPEGFMRIAGQLAADVGWLAYRWAPPCAEVFMREADAIIWLDDELARAESALERDRRRETDLAVMAFHGAKRVMRWWRERRSGEGADGGLLEVAMESQAADLTLTLASMALNEWGSKVLRVTHGGQVAALNGVRPTR